MPKNPILELPRASAGNIVLNPAGWPQPKGYANGIKARGEMVFVGGMIGWDIHGKLPQGFVAQTRQLLENIVAVLKENIERFENANGKIEAGEGPGEIGFKA